MNFGRAFSKARLSGVCVRLKQIFALSLFYSYGFVLGPAVGAIFMSLSTIIVAVNAQLLKKQIKTSVSE